MSNTLKHGFTSAKADDVDTSLIQPSHWNSEHVFAGGALGSLLYRDTGSTDGANWLADVASGSVLVSGGVGAAPAFSSTPALKLGSGTGTVRVGGVVDLSRTSAQTGANTTETDLYSFTLPANSLSATGRALRLTVFGSVAANANAKTIRAYFGASVHFIANAFTNNNVQWFATFLIVPTGAATEAFVRQYLNFGGGSIFAPSINTPTESLASDIVIRVTGQNGTASSGDIVLSGAILEGL